MVQKLSIVFLLLFYTYSLQAQYCGTEVSKQQADYLRKQQPALHKFNGKITRGIRDIPIKIHVISAIKQDESSLVNNILEGIDNLNEHFIQSNIRFVALAEVNFIVDATYCDMSPKKEAAIGRDHDIKKVINLYVTDQVNGGRIAGYTSMPPGPDRVIVDKLYVSGSTLVHEMGHYFSLYHTHGKTNYEGTDELVNGENCKIAGDEICDTPADPNVYGLIDAGCAYTGKLRDKNRDLYKPEMDNFMSYSLTPCRTKFSKKQQERIAFALLHERNHLTFPTNTEPEPKKEEVLNLGGELVFSITGQEMQADLDANIYKMKETYYSGTNYQLHVNTDQSAYVYVFSTDKTKKSNLLFPMPHQDPYLEGPNTAIALPDKFHMFQLDNTVGKDYVYVLYSNEPLEPQKIRKEMELKSGTFMQRLYKVLGEKVIPANQIKYTNNGALRFTAQTTNKKAAIVPIVVEIDHQ